MKIGIADADLIGRFRHMFPNLACMKLSSYHKVRGDYVQLLTDYDSVLDYDRVYISKVFSDTEVPAHVLNHPHVQCGGTGFYYDKARPLPSEIEHAFPDYHLYDEWVTRRIAAGDNPHDYRYYTDYSIGFITRGCFRKCPFCVNRNYDKVDVHSSLEEFVDPSRPKICLLDDNFLGCKDWKTLLLQLQATGKPFQFKQGLDERLLNDEKCELLFVSRYDGDYIFAFDNIEDYDIVERKLQLLRRHTNRIPKFYVFCAYDRQGKWDADFWRQDMRDLWKRIELLMKYQCLPYIMRFARYEESPYSGMYTVIARWCNQPSFFKKKSFREFVHKDQERYKKECASMKRLRAFEKEMPELASRYFDMKYQQEGLS